MTTELIELQSPDRRALWRVPGSVVAGAWTRAAGQLCQWRLRLLATAVFQRAVRIQARSRATARAALATCASQRELLAAAAVAPAGLLLFAADSQSPLGEAALQNVLPPAPTFWPGWYHPAINLAVHTLASLLVFVLALELVHARDIGRATLSRNQRLLAAALAALLVATHPVSGLAVRYAYARDVLLAQVCLTASLLVYARMRRAGESVLRWTLLLLLLTAALLTSTSALLAPLLFLAFDVLLRSESLGDRRVWQRAAAPATVVFAYLLHNALQSGLPGFLLDAWVTTVLTEARFLVFHALPLVWWPFSIRLLPALEPGAVHDCHAWLGLAFVAATFCVALYLRGRSSMLAFCIVAYWLVQFGSAAAPGEPTHYAGYAASAFLLVGLAAALLQHTHVRAALPALLVLALYLAATSRAQNRYWTSGEALWTHSVQHGGSGAAHLNLALAIEDRSDARVRQHLEWAVLLDPALLTAQLHLCRVLVESGDIEAGLRRCDDALAEEPARAASWYQAAAAFRAVDRPWDALRAAEQAAALEPDNVEYHYQAALAAQAVRNWEASLEHTHHVRSRVLSYRELEFVRGYALQMLRRDEEAVTEYRRLLKTMPDHVQVNYNTGSALVRLGRCSEAAPYLRAVMKLSPDHAEARHYLAECPA